jgi:predicted TIM-barrel fold metal-dependent hydrolase
VALFLNDFQTPGVGMDASRRDFLRRLAGLGAGAILAGGSSHAQAPPGEARRIDVHQHYVSPDYLALLTRRNAVSPVAGFAQWKGYTPEKNLAEMDRTGVSTAMLSPTAPGVWFGDVAEARRTAREMNEYAAAKMVGNHKGRFGLFAALPIPDIDGSLREIEYAFDTLKADGVGLLTSYGDKWLGDPSFSPIFDELNRRKAVVYTHPLEASCCRNLVGGVTPQTLEYPTDTTRTLMSLIVSNTATRCPDVRFIFSHAGGTIVSIAGRFLGTAVTAENLALPAETNSRLYHVRRFYYDTAGAANPIQMQSLKLLVPASQIVFGTDFPFANPAATVAGLQNSGFSAEELRGIYRNNALKFLPRYA